MLGFIVQKLNKRYDPDNFDESMLTWKRTDQRGAEKCHKLLAVCSYVDPRFKGSLTPADVVQAQEDLVDELTVLDQTSGKIRFHF